MPLILKSKTYLGYFLLYEICHKTLHNYHQRVCISESANFTQHVWWSSVNKFAIQSKDTEHSHIHCELDLSCIARGPWFHTHFGRRRLSSHLQQYKTSVPTKRVDCMHNPKPTIGYYVQKFFN